MARGERIRTPLYTFKLLLKFLLLALSLTSFLQVNRMNYLRRFKEMRGSSDSFFRIVLVIALLFGIVFRLGNLDTKPYWRDEVYTSMRVSGYELGTMKEGIHGQLIPVTTLRQYLNVANATFCLACTSPILIRYAQEARPYSLWMVGILLSSIALLSALRQSRGRTWMLYSATVAFMLTTQLLSFFVLFAHSLYVLVLFKSAEAPEVNGKKTKHFFVSLAAGTVPIIPWLGPG